MSPPAPGSAIIAARNIRKTFPTGTQHIDAVRGVDLTVNRGDFVVIFGPSGCGKSTFLNILTGIDTPSSGQVIVNGTNIFTLNEEDRGIFRSQKIGIVHQMFYWVKSLNVLENVAMPLIINGLAVKDAMAKAYKSLEAIRIENLASQAPSQLSGGEQQRVGIARALVSQPDIIVADEPTGNLDSTASDQIMGLLSMLNSRLNRTVILVTHNPAYWEIGTNRVEMKDGQKVKETRHASIS